jgi:hypothetical protein
MELWQPENAVVYINIKNSEHKCKTFYEASIKKSSAQDDGYEFRCYFSDESAPEEGRVSMRRPTKHDSVSIFCSTKQGVVLVACDLPELCVLV